jgi:N-acetyl-anhydromuramyl-L-alanine amidase AmpD
MIVPGIPYVQGRNSYSDADGVKYGIAIHNTSNDASDTGEASYATWRPDGTSSHFYADADSVTQSLDTVRKAGHAGSTQGNENAIAVEITGGNGMSLDWWLANVAWSKLGQVLAAVIRHHWPDGSFQVRRASVAEMRANPKVKAFYGHDDMRLAWGGTTHTDPGGSFPWDRLFAAVNAALGINGGDDMSELASRVIEAWSVGMKTTTAGELVAPTHWQIANEQFQADMRRSLAADEARDKAVLAAVTALAAAGGVDAAPIVAAIESVKAEVLAALAERAELEAAADRARADVLDGPTG